MDHSFQVEFIEQELIMEVGPVVQAQVLGVEEAVLVAVGALLVVEEQVEAGNFYKNIFKLP